MKVTFFDPHPNDGTGPSVPMPQLVKGFLDILDGHTVELSLVIDHLNELLQGLGIAGKAKPVTQHTLGQDRDKDAKYILLKTFPHGKDKYPQHNWLAIKYQPVESIAGGLGETHPS